jgi:23S rRNA (uracil1939-C5)-methyltransferase
LRTAHRCARASQPRASARRTTPAREARDISEARRAASSGAGDETLEITSLAAGGEGIAREPSGRVLFVRGGVPGDLVRVRIAEAHKRFARAEIAELVRASKARVAPPCAVHGECGGCGWQQIDYETQLAAKRAILCDALSRIGGVQLETLEAPVEVARSPQPYGTRSRARLLFRNGRVGYRRARSHALVATSECPILAPPLARALAQIAASPPRGEGELDLACGDDGAVSVSGARLPGFAQRDISLAAPGGRVGVSPRGFFQAHATLRGALADAVLAGAGEGGRLLELHAGAGFFTLGLAARFREVVAVESAPRAASDLRANLARAGRGGVRVLEMRAARALASREVQGFAPEAIVLDPPRTGIGEGEARALAGLRARRVVYVSCDPVTLARDLRVLIAAGYRLARCDGFDLFPQTPHVEALAVLTRALERPA